MIADALLLPFIAPTLAKSCPGTRDAYSASVVTSAPSTPVARVIINRIASTIDFPLNTYHHHF
jgi:hypothetical protein